MVETIKNPSLKRLILAIIFFYAVTFLGAFLFIYIEECRNNRQNNVQEDMNSKLETHLRTVTNSNEDEVLRILNITGSYFSRKNRERCVFDRTEILKWWDFTFVSLYTIGFGDTVPHTDAGKITTIIYCCFGIPITVVVYTMAAAHVKKICGKFIEIVEKNLLKRTHVHNIEQKQIALCLFVLFMAITIGGCLLTVESYGNMSWTNSYYYWFQITTTIGFGDILPDGSETILIFITSRIFGIFIMGLSASTISGATKLIYDSLLRENE